MSARFLALTLLVALGASYVVASEKVVMCYYGTWATYRRGLGKFDVEDIDPYLCSHVIYSFVGINFQGSVISLDSGLDIGKNNFGRLHALKRQNPKLKTLLAVGGWSEGSYKYSVMAANPTYRKNFISSALYFVLMNDFDGFDIDWEYPARRDTAFGRADVNNFSQLIKEIKKEFEKYNLLVTAAVAAVGEMAALSYDIPKICKYLDYINLMTYDLYGGWDPVTGHNAPLYKGEGDNSIAEHLLHTVDKSVQYWLDEGCPPEKLVVGVPFYGRTFWLANAGNSNVRAPNIGPGISGPFTGSPGSIGYNEFCDKLRTQSWDRRWDNKAKVPYAVQGRNWVSYDDPESIAIKTRYALSKNVGGIMMWSIESDDFHGICLGGKFPLLKAINKALGRIVDVTEPPPVTSTPETVATDAPGPNPPAPVASSTTTTTTTAKPVTEASTTAAPSPTSVCTSEENAPHPEDCSQFFMCIRDVHGRLIPVLFRCPHGLNYDVDSHTCTFPSEAKCSN